MRSLRSRLILGSALIAVVPLAVAIFLLSRQVTASFEREAGVRLAAALTGLDAQLRLDAERVAERLRILGNDAGLKRLYLVGQRSGRDLGDFVEERRRLLGLDYLHVLDLAGEVVAEAASSDTVGAPTLGGTAPIVFEGAPVGSLGGGLRIDLAYLERLERTSGVKLAIPEPGDGIAAGIGRVTVGDSSYLARTIPLAIAAPPGTRVRAMVSTRDADRTIASLRATALGLAGIGLLIAVAFAFLWSSLVSRPVERLADFSKLVSHGELEAPLELQSVRELQTLVEALERMRVDLQTYRNRLVVTERQAAWGQMARKVAHEIKNPLTPIAISVEDLVRSHEQRRADYPEILERAARTVREEIERLRRLLQEFSDYGRFPAPRPARCSVRDLLAGLEGLYAREIEDGRLAVSPSSPGLAISADAEQLRQALVNLVKNGLEAVASAPERSPGKAAGKVEVSAAERDGALEIAVADDGPGLTEEQRASLFVPGFSTKQGGSGLGLTITERIVSDHGGTVAAEPRPGGGTVFRVRLPLESGSRA